MMNGYGNGQAEITTTGDVPTVITVNFPKTNYGGGIEETEGLRDVKHEYINLNIDTPTISRDYYPIGFDLGWTYHYEDFIKDTDLYASFYPILKAWKNKWTIKLTPRVDVPERYFYVHLANETLSLMLRKARAGTKYIKGSMFQFLATETQDDPNWILPSEPNTVFTVFRDRISI